MDCLVTGGAGFIGSNLVRELLAAGKSVRVLDNMETGRRENIEPFLADVEFVRGDIRSPETAAACAKGIGTVFHQAALASVARSVEDPVLSNGTNVSGTLNMLVAARDAGVERFVFASSSSVYGDTPELPKREAMPARPLSPYGLQKLAGEEYCRIFFPLYGLKTYSLRYFNVFGPGQDPASEYAAVVPSFIEAVLRGRPPLIHGDGEQTRDFTFVGDVVRANIACMDAPGAAAGDVFNVAGGKRVSINSLLAAIVKAAGVEVSPEHGPAREGDVRDSQADCEKAARRLGWRPSTGLETGLARTVEWFSK